MISDMVLASEIEPGRYICLRTASTLGWLVRLFCRSPYDHVVIATGGGMCVEATVRGVKRTPLVTFTGCQAVANSAEDMSDDQRADVVSYVEDRVGEEYGFQFLAVILARKLGWRPRWLLKVSADSDAYICSELAAGAGHAASPPLPWLCGEPSPMCVRPDELAAREVCRPVVWDWLTV